MVGTCTKYAVIPRFHRDELRVSVVCTIVCSSASQVTTSSMVTGFVLIRTVISDKLPIDGS